MSDAPLTIPVADPVRFLAGAWRVERELDDQLPDRSGTFVGTADFVPEGNGLRWTETGDAELGGYSGRTSRVLLVQPTDEAWEVRFEDGRFFHPLDLRAGPCAVVHPCAADEYRGDLRVTAPDRMLITWRVTGPEKDQTIVSRYTR